MEERRPEKNEKWLPSSQIDAPFLPALIFYSIHEFRYPGRAHATKFNGGGKANDREGSRHISPFIAVLKPFASQKSREAMVTLVLRRCGHCQGMFHFVI